MKGQVKKMASTMYNNLLITARELERGIDTEWTDAHESAAADFAEQLEQAHDGGQISDAEHDNLAMIAFYDYDIIFLGDDEDDERWAEFLQLEKPVSKYHDVCGRARR